MPFQPRSLILHFQPCLSHVVFIFSRTLETFFHFQLCPRNTLFISSHAQLCFYHQHFQSCPSHVLCSLHSQPSSTHFFPFSAVPRPRSFHFQSCPRHVLCPLHFQQKSATFFHFQPYLGHILFISSRALDRSFVLCIPSGIHPLFPFPAVPQPHSFHFRSCPRHVLCPLHFKRNSATFFHFQPCRSHILFISDRALDTFFVLCISSGIQPRFSIFSRAVATFFSFPVVPQTRSLSFAFPAEFSHVFPFSVVPQPHSFHFQSCPRHVLCPLHSQRNSANFFHFQPCCSHILFIWSRDLDTFFVLCISSRAVATFFHFQLCLSHVVFISSHDLDTRSFLQPRSSISAFSAVPQTCFTPLPRKACLTAPSRRLHFCKYALCVVEGFLMLVPNRSLPYSHWMCEHCHYSHWTCEHCHYSHWCV